jgi:tetratricopeptide (TPR) repeat protein
LGRAMAAQGKHEAAASSAEHALRLSPGDALVGGTALHTIVFARFTAARYPEAVAAAHAMIERYPEYFPAHYVLIAALGMIGDGDAAAKAITRLVRMKPDFSMAWLFANMPWAGEIGARLTEGWRKAGVPEIAMADTTARR